MSKSNKSRNGTQCKHWKDTVLESRSQKQAWTKTKQRRSQQERTQAKAQLRNETSRGT
jgi:hypothetical protein